jgi:hypothetical protein
MVAIALVSTWVLGQQPAGDVHVRIETDVPADIEEVDSSENYVSGMVYVPNAGVVVPNIKHRESAHRLCTAPCAVTMPQYRAALEHRIVSEAVTDAGGFTFSDQGPAVLVRIKSGNAYRYNGGKFATIAGGVTLGLGALAAFIGSLLTDGQVPFIAGGLTAVGVGALSLVLGILAMLNNRTAVDIDADPTYVAPPTAPPVAPEQL